MTFTIKTSLGLAFTVLILLIVTAGSSGILSLSASNGRMQDFSIGPFVRVKQIGAMQAEVMNLARALNIAVAARDDAVKRVKIKQWQEGAVRFDAVLKQYEHDLPAALMDQARRVRAAWLAYPPEVTKVFALTTQNTNQKAADLYLTTGEVAAKRLDAALDALAALASGLPRETEQLRLIDAIRLDATALNVVVGRVVASTDAAAERDLNAESVNRSQRIDASLSRLSGVDGNALANLRAAWQSLVQVYAETLRLGMLDSDAQATAIVLGPCTALRTTVSDLLSELQSKEDALAQTAIADTAASYAGTRAFLLGLVVSAVVVGVVCAWRIGRTVADPIAVMTRAMGAIAGGDLSVEVPALTDRNEIGAMARAVQIFKENAARLRTTQAEAERQRRIGDEERAANAAMRAEIQRQQEAVVSALAEGLDSLAKGRLTGRINDVFTSEYEKLRADFNVAMQELQETMKVLAGNAQAIRSGTDEITTATDDLSRRTEQQAASLEETAAALDEITATVRKTAESANHARSLVGTAKANAERSGQVVRQAVDAMGGIETSAREIGQIIGVIDEIAFQTNLLALNAGVEAARAGDAGRGFAVVASEVRALAQRSADAAKQIKTLVSASGAQVARGVDFVGQTGETLNRIVAQVTEIDGIVTEIAASAQEQASGLAQVNTAVNQMDQVTQQNAAMVEESTAASQALAGETAELARLIGRFDLGVPALQATARKATTSTPVHALKAVGRGGAARNPEPEGWTEF